MLFFSYFWDLMITFCFFFPFTVFNIKQEIIDEDEEESNCSTPLVSMDQVMDSCYQKALEGFVIVLSPEGDIIYLSDSVAKYLGLKQVSLLCSTNYIDRFPSSVLFWIQGSTRICKWRTSAYWKTEVGGIRCKILSKKGVIWCGHQKNGVFLVWTPTNGGHSVCKNAKVCKFYFKIAAKLLNYSKCMRSA